MTDDNSISRRSLLATTGTIGLTSLAGCLDPTSDSWILSEGSGNVPDPTTELRDVTVKEAPTNRSNSFFLAVSDDILSSEEVTVFNGQQVRVKVQNDIEGAISDPCLYTVDTNPGYTSDEENTVWMSEEGMDRLGIVEGSLLVLQPHSASPRFETRNAGQENNELIEQHIDNKEGYILFMAPHGGDIFKKTELQALRGSSINDYSSWAIMCYASSRELAVNRWYNPPESYTINSFIGLLELDSPFSYAVSFTGMNLTDDATNKEVVIGGLAEDSIKENIKSELEKTFTPSTENSTNSGEDGSDSSSSDDSSTSEDSSQSSTEPAPDPTVDISIAYEGDLSDTEPRHIANNLTEDDSNGIVIHQTKPVRDKHWKKVADAVMSGIEQRED